MAVVINERFIRSNVERVPLRRLHNVASLPERKLEKVPLTDEMKAARDNYAARWEQYSPARDEQQFRIKEEKARRESELNSSFAKKLRDEYK